ncbi:flagellin N-terminal helical domain-containing protein [Bdellovibrio bacteriovorus]|uniref:Flagellin n=2 Tax=Bdellovibrio bacteriovorus TaxID=959 RepID=Q6H8R3_BDEBC|nr:flagellin [Bdellovibrio bacteriovorus]AHZ83443.1 flagellin [Bdellovibrio bacteriovorus]ASD62805.1 flagellin [Bdellovibrio bacteriovorus]CAE80817.1 flagellin [Bdellovibrio bacteriovorus HD100]CAG38108.1 flagellin [Bdellovibrio bacteriovorus]BEV69412.1 Flagellin [Bdellovibrio bacteriovorus]
MGMRVTTNISALNAQRNLVGSQRQINDSMAKLASGSRINKAADDAAGLAISEGLKAQIRSAAQAQRNANDGISMVQTAEGGLNEIGNIVVRLRELGIQAASDTVGETERGMLNKEVQQLKSEMQRIASVTTWGTTKLLDGSSPKFDFQVGLFNNSEEDRISFNASENVATLDALGLSGVDFSTKEGAQEALGMLDNAQTSISGTRANLGALQNRLTSTVDNLGVAQENLSAANSRIRDTDVAQASSEMTRNNILLQAGTSTLAQANQSNQLALKLIG